MPYDHLLAPMTLRGLELRNRVVFPAMATGFVADGGHVSDQLIDYHVARAEGGCGLLITECCSVHTPSAPRNFLSIADDTYVAGLRRFTDAVHAAGARCAVQLWQGGMAAWGQDPAALELVTASGLPTPGGQIPGSSVEKIAEVVQAWGEAAARAVAAGFDAVEFHCAHNYSPHSFLSPALNQRTDEYGGSFENRARYPLECIRAIRASIPDDMPLLMRIDALDDELPGGLTRDDVIAFCRLAQEAGVDVLDVSRGNIVTSAIKYEVPPIDLERGFNVENAAAIRRGTGMPTIAVGRINHPAQGDDIIASGMADMVVVGRGQIADPDFCRKAAEGRAEDIVMCVACNQGCFDRFVLGQPITCLRNPRVGREGEGTLQVTGRPRRVLVAGGGVAGIEAALVLQERGHRPVLCEASGALGGQFELAGHAPRKGEMRDAAVSRGEQAVRAGVEVRLSTPVTPALIDEVAPDAVVVATGAVPRALPVPVEDGANLTDAFAVLRGEAPAVRSGVRSAVVIGGGLVGLEAAEHLAEQGVAVTVVETAEAVGGDLGQLRRICVMEAVAREGITVVTDATCARVTAAGVVVESDGELGEIAADLVVAAVGSVPVDHSALVEHCAARGIECHVVGDAVSARRAIDAIAEAYEVARAL
ncbi:FAD-dependent oxidoreductase [Actinotalea sp. JY-7876]|uniref:bile acid Fe-S flavoenzyme BaiCD n=1 Tax=Actinotalea sp. JY-7876 TaxID=2758442 RepID=UPI0015F6557B|nr:FAD-dependent oxidoreductase [Actinotalea sp. JY-7876]